MAVKHVCVFAIIGVLVFKVYGMNNIIAKKSYGSAKLVDCNENYVTNCSVVTFERKDTNRIKLLTNMSFTFLVPVGNNVTTTAILESASGVQFKVDHPLCNYFRQKWLLDFLRPQEMSLPPPCPIQPGRFHLDTIEFPPKKIPIPVRSGTYKLFLELILSNKSERVLAVETNILY